MEGVSMLRRQKEKLRRI